MSLPLEGIAGVNDAGSLVNEFTGQAAFAVSLGGVQNHHGLQFELKLLYSGQATNQLHNSHWKYKSTTWVGSGFALEAPRILTVGNSSTRLLEQKYVLATEGGVQSELEPIGANQYILKADPFTIITKYTTSVSSTLVDRCPSQVGQTYSFPFQAIDYWKLETPNGTTIYFGEQGKLCDETQYELCLPVVDKGIRYQPFYDISGFSKSPLAFYAQKIVDRREKFAIWLDYAKSEASESLIGQCNSVTNNLNPANILDRAVYLKEVYTTNGVAKADPKTTQALFYRSPKTGDGTFDPVPGNPMALHEKDKLDRIEFRQGGITVRELLFSYSTTGRRMRLSGIAVKEPTFQSSRPYLSLEYEAGSPWAIKQLVDGAGRIVEYGFGSVVAETGSGSYPVPQDITLPVSYPGDRVAFARQAGTKFYLQVENWESNCLFSPPQSCYERLYEFENRGNYWSLKRTFTAPFPRSPEYMDFYMAPDGSYFIWAYPKTVPPNGDVLQMEVYDLTTDETNPSPTTLIAPNDGGHLPKESHIYTYPQWFAVSNFTWGQNVDFFHKDENGAWKGIDQCPSDIAFARYNTDLFSGESEGVTGCLTFASKVQIFPGPDFLAVVNNDKDILHVFGYDGGIKDFVHGLQASTPTLSPFTAQELPDAGLRAQARPWYRHSSGHHNNWQKNIITAAVSDNIIVVLCEANSNWMYLYALGWDGRQLRYLYDEPVALSGSGDPDAYDVYAGKDYFVVKNMHPDYKGIFHYKVDPKLWKVSKSLMMGFTNDTPEMGDWVVNAESEFIFVEKMQQGKAHLAYAPAYVSESSDNGPNVPQGSLWYPHDGEGRVYALNQDRLPVDATHNFTRDGLFFDVFSNNCTSSGDRILCAESQIEYRTAPRGTVPISRNYQLFRQGAGGFSSNKFNPGPTPSGQFWTARLVSGGVMGTRFTKTATEESLVGLTFYPDPYGFVRVPRPDAPTHSYPGFSVVTSVKVKTKGPQSKAKDVQVVNFSYPESAPEPGAPVVKPLWNHLAEAPNFKVVRQDFQQGATVKAFIRDDRSTPLAEKDRGLNGVPQKVWVLPDNADWKKPGGRIDVIKTVATAPVPSIPGAHQLQKVASSSRIFFHEAHQDAYSYLSNYDNKNGIPKVSVVKRGDAYVVSLSIYEHDLNPPGAAPYNLLRQTATFRFPTFPCTPDPLDPCKNIKLSPFFADVNNLKKIVASTIITYDANKLPNATYEWQAEALGNVYPDLDGIPDQPSGAGWKWVKKTEVLGRQSNPVARCKSDAATESESMGIPTATFFGGNECNPLGMVTNSKLATADLLTGEEDIRQENCSDPGNCLGATGRWERAETSLQGNVVHSGEKAIQVTTLYGPSIDLKLREYPGFMDRKKGFMVSGWIFAKPGSNPAFRVEFRDNTSPPDIGHLRDPIVHAIDLVQEYIDGQGPFPTNRWIKLERQITFQELSGHGIFSSTPSHDYLRIWLGKGAVAGDAVFVDDVRLYPADAAFSTLNVDPTGLVTSRLDEFNEMIYLEYDAHRKVVGVRRPNGQVDAAAAVKLFNE